MKLTLYTDDLREAPVDLLALGVFSDEPDRGLAFAHLNRALDGALEQACRDEEFKGAPGQTVCFNVGQGVRARRILVYGFGERDRYDAEAARRFAGVAGRICRGVSAASLALVLTVRDVPDQDHRVVELVEGLAEGVFLGGYAFSTYLTKERKELRLKDVRIAFAAEDVQGVKGAALRNALVRGQVLAEAVMAARDLVNEPANTLTPTLMAEIAKRVAKTHGLGFKVLGPKDMEKQGMGLLLGVAKGSEEEPRLIHITYEPAGLAKDAPVICFVGKGLTFDSGGLSIKDSESMMAMKNDMGGGAAVIGAMQAIAQLKPACTVHGIVAATENMPDGRAIRPGDVLRSKKGLTVEVLNTDAEGRLALADAIAYALELEPTDLIDVATLTGACMVALGRLTAGYFASDEDTAQDVSKAIQRSGERFWRLPLETELREMLKSDIADIKNIGERWGGAITAALFLKEFVDGAPVRWAHLDIAGPVVSQKDTGYLAKGGTGFAVRSLVEYVVLRQKPATSG
jgi:leucyl aminopeptidase